MSYSLEDYFRLATAHLPSALACAQTVESMAALSRSLPPTADFGFESRLTSAEASLDLFARIRDVDGSRRAFAGLNPHVTVPDELLAHDAWRRLRAFCARWHDEADPLHAAIGDMWLEFDSAVYGRERPTPCIFFSLRKRGCEGAEIAEDACRTLFGAPDFSLTEVMRRAFEGASTRGWVEHVGLMLSRPDTPLRLVMVGLPPDELFAALGELGWSGDVAALHRYQERLGELVSGYALAIDADAKLRPRVGIEWYLGERRRATVGQFLDRCVEMELARPEKAAAIIDWPGVVKREAAGDFWPPNLAAGELQFGLRSAFLRQLNHFKLVYADGMPAEMKAYFGLTHVWVKPSKGAPSESVARP